MSQKPKSPFSRVAVVWGVPAGMKEFKPFMEGKVKLRFRNKSAGRAFLKTEGGIREFIIIDEGDYWTIDPKLEQGRNHRP